MSFSYVFFPKFYLASFVYYVSLNTLYNCCLYFLTFNWRHLNKRKYTFVVLLLVCFLSYVSVLSSGYFGRFMFTSTVCVLCCHFYVAKSCFLLNKIFCNSFRTLHFSASEVLFLHFRIENKVTSCFYMWDFVLFCLFVRLILV